MYINPYSTHANHSSPLHQHLLERPSCSSLLSANLPATHQLHLRNGGQVLLRRQQRREHHEGHPGAYAPSGSRGSGARPVRVVHEQVSQADHGQWHLGERRRDRSFGFGGHSDGPGDRHHWCAPVRGLLGPGGRDGARGRVRRRVLEGDGGQSVGASLRVAAHRAGLGDRRAPGGPLNIRNTSS
ncbi:hypothetical protein M758_1G285300 [Ceratodon purpureus]|nr:hypothetical protein M758_1G285300 [Ceratodon purpureus]